MFKKEIKKIIATAMCLITLCTFTTSVLANGTSDYPFILPDGLTADGNATDGYTLTGDNNKVAVLTTPIDISKQNIQLKTEITGAWDYLAFANTTVADTNIFNASKEEGAVSFRLTKSGDKLGIRSFTGTDKIIKEIPSFDFTKAHTFGFDNIDGKWWLTVDNNAVVDLTTNDDAVVSERLNALKTSGTAYVQLAAYAGNFPNATADFTNIKIVEQIPFNYPSGLTADGNANDGYSLTGEKNKVAVLRTPIDISKQNIQLKTDITGDWAYLSFANTTVADTNIFNASKEEGAVSFRLTKSGDKLGIRSFTGTDKIIKEIPSFDFTKAHTFGFDNIDGKWWLTVDNNAVVDLTTNDDAVVSERLNALKTSGKAYVRLASYNYDADFANIKIVEQIPFNYPSGMTVGGNATDGYTLAGDKEKVAVLRTPIDISNENIQLKTAIPNGWAFLAFTNSDFALSGIFADEKEKDTNDAVIFRFAKVGNETVAIYYFSNTGTDLLKKVSGFDFSVAHTYGFKNESGNWWLTVDGNAVVDLTTDDDPVVAQRLDKLSASGKAYVQLASYGEAADFSGIKITALQSGGDNPGDCNKDGVIDICDLVCLNKKIADSNNSSFVLAIDDINGDGVVNADDLSALRKKLLG